MVIIHLLIYFLFQNSGAEVRIVGNKNGKKAVVPLSGIYGKLDEEQSEKKNWQSKSQ